MNIAALFSGLAPGLEDVAQELTRQKEKRKEEERYQDEMTRYERRAAMEESRFRREERDALLNKINAAASIFSQPAKGKDGGNLEGFEKALKSYGVQENSAEWYSAHGLYTTYNEVYQKQEYDKLIGIKEKIAQAGIDPNLPIDEALNEMSKIAKGERELRENVQKAQIRASDALTEQRGERTGGNIDLQKGRKDFFDFATKFFPIKDPNDPERIIGIDWENAANNFGMGGMMFMKMMGLGQENEVMKPESDPLSQLKSFIDSEGKFTNWSPDALKVLEELEKFGQRPKMKPVPKDYFSPYMPETWK